jgi:hypothetical protein
MEDTAYNRKILNQIKAINNKYVKTMQKRGGMVDENELMGAGLMSLLGLGQPMQGAGFLSGILGSIGLGKDMNGGIQTGGSFLDDLGSLAPLAMLALGKPHLGKPHLGGISTGSGVFDDLADVAKSIGSSALSLAPLLALGKPSRRKAGSIALDNRDQSFQTPVNAGRRHGGISTGGMMRKLLNARAVGSGLAEMEGSGIFDDILDNTNKILGTASQAASLAKLFRGKGKSGMEGAGIFDDILSGVTGTLGTVAQGTNLAKQLGFLGKGKRRRAGIQTGGIETGGRKRAPSKWIQHVKAYSKKHGLKYNECLKDQGCKDAYRKMK